MNLPDGYPYRERKLGFEWSNESRHLRIREVLASKTRISIEDSMQLQNDVLSIPARRLGALLAPLTSSNPKTRAALNLLKGWDYVELAESPQAALMEVWLSRHLDKAFKAALLPKAAAELVETPDLANLLSTLESPDTRLGEKPVAKRNEILLASLTSAYIEMETLQGSDPTQWQWGKLQQSFAEHPLSSALDETARKKLNVGPFPRGGSTFTPNQSRYRANDFRQTNGPSFRIIVDVGRWDNSWAVNMPGQSGDPDSRHYRDLTDRWRKGEYFPLRYTRAGIEEVTEQVIRLVPAT
jgi:penicillin amidase